MENDWLFRKNTTFWVNRGKSDNVKNPPITIKDRLRKYTILRKINNFLKKIN